MSDWKETNLGAIANYINRGISPKYVIEDGIPVINQKCIRNGIIDNKYIKFHNKDRKITDSKTLENEDILINSTGVGTAGRVAIFESPDVYIADSHVTILRIDKSIALPKYVFYNLRKREDEIEGYAEGSTGQIELGRERVKSIDILLPSLHEQRTIASILSSLDDKIILLNRQNKTLEAMAETLFRQWFVEEAEDSWEIGKISDLIEFNPKRSLSKGSIAPYLEMSNLSNELYHPTNWYDREFSSGTKFVNGDTLLARITPCLENGKTAFVDFLEENQVGWGSTEYIVMRSKNNLHLYFSYIIARYEDFRNYAIGCMVGSSGRQRADVDNIMDYEISIPSEEIIEKFNKSINAILLKMNNNNIQSRALAKLRDELLPKLMSGEIKIS